MTSRAASAVLADAIADARLDWIVPEWPAPDDVCALATTRNGGVSTGARASMNLGRNVRDDASALAENRRRLARFLPVAPTWLDQVHGPVVAMLSSKSDDGKAPVADAAVTRERGVVCGVLTADCLPILVCADDGAEFAAIHAGWRGLCAGVIESCITRLLTPRERLLAWLGPAIGPKSYEVGDDVRSAFVDADASVAHAFVETRPGHWHCDLYALARRRLALLGVTHVFGGGFDTLVDSRFYSYRRDGMRSGRQATLIWRADHS